MPTKDLPTDPIARIEAKIDALDEKVDSHWNGNPAAGIPGAWIRLDRVERFVAAMVWGLSVVGLAVLGLVVEAFTGHPMKR